MFRTIADIDLFQLTTIHDFLRHSLITIDQIKQLFDDNQGHFPLAIQLEQFILEQFLSSSKRETFRDESLLDFYTSIFNDLLHGANYTHKQIICILTLIQGLLCQMEKGHVGKLNEAFIHACSILMGGGHEQKKSVLFTTQQYPKVIDYIIQTIFQHQHLYEVMLEDKPQEIKKIEEQRTIDFHVFEQAIFPCPLIEGLPLSVYREIILQIPPPTPLLSDPDQLSRESLSTTIIPQEENNTDLNATIDNISRQYPDISRDDIRQMFTDISQEYLSEHKLKEKEVSFLAQLK